MSARGAARQCAMPSGPQSIKSKQTLTITERSSVNRRRNPVPRDEINNISQRNHRVSLLAKKLELACEYGGPNSHGVYSNRPESM